MSLRVLILYNDDLELAHGEPHDGLAAAAVLEEVRAVADACRESGWEPVALAAPREPQRLLEVIEQAHADAIFNLVEALAGEVRLEAAVAWVYELARVPYTGSPPAALSLALQKHLTNAALRGLELPVPRGRVLERGDEPLEDLCPPLIVKPTREDASHGISLDSVATGHEAARARARYVIERYRQPALVEEFVEGREFNVSLLGEGQGARVLPLAEIDYTGFPAGQPRLVTYAAKWVEESQECRGTNPVAPTDLAPELADAIARIALAAYRAIGLRDYGRIDIRLHPERGPLILDVNSNPDISPTAGLARAALRGGMTYARLVAQVVEWALARAAPGTRK
jgi:D-alanine-D-alanine ligase